MRYFLPLLLITSTLSAAPTPTRVASFGPNGTHWPGQITGLTTPYMYDDTVPNITEVACSWSAISAAVSAFSDAQVNAGAMVLVQPGTLPGYGAGGTSTSVLSGIGNEAWTKRVTIAPRDGWGTVTISSGIKLNNVANICLAGFPINGGLRVTDSTQFAFARIIVTGYIVFYLPSALSEADKWELSEFVKRDVNLVSDDVMQWQVDQSGATDHVRDCVIDGSYFAPNYMPIGSTAHQDTIQHLGAGGTYRFYDETIRDTAIFASNRCAVNGGLENAIIQHCWINSRKNNQTSLYPVPSGYEMLSTAGLSQGTWGNTTFDSGYYMGPLQSNQGIDTTPYDTVLNSATIDYTPTGYVAPVTGSWVVDNTMNGDPNPGYPTLPTDEYLASIWSEGAAGVVETPAISPPGGQFDATQSVIITCSTPSSTIYYTTDGSTPTTGSTEYTGAFNVSADSTVKAFATAAGSTDSAVASADFVFKVATPVIVPSDLLSLYYVNLSISSSTSGASIYYRTDGVNPDETDTLYTGPFPISETSEVRAIAIKAGLINSDITTSQVTIGTFTTIGGFQNIIFPARYGTFTVEYDATPHSANMDGFMGFSSDESFNYTQVSAKARFWTDGTIQARDGTTYTAEATVNYSAETSYHFRWVINVASDTFDLYVTPSGGSETQIASAYAFDAASTGSLGYITMAAETGSYTLENVVMYAATPSSSGAFSMSSFTTVSAMVTPVPTPSPTPPPVSYYLEENFEGVGIPGGFSTYGGTQNLDFDYTTSPLEATESFRINSNTATSCRGVQWNSLLSDAFCVYFLWSRANAPTSDASIFQVFRNSDSQLQHSLRVKTGGNIELFNGISTTDGAYATSTATTYHIWIDKAASGGAIEVRISTNSTKPASADMSLPANYGGDVGKLVFGSMRSMDIKFDKIRVGDTIGSDPE